MRQFSHQDTVYPDVYLFDTADLSFPEDWIKQLVDMSGQALPVEVDGSHPTSREDRQEIVIYRQLGGQAIQDTTPWLFEAYYGELLELAKRACGEDVLTNDDPRDVMNLLVNAAGQRGEAHVDNAPVSLLVYPQPAEEDGRLFIHPDTSVEGYEEIVATGIPIEPEVGTGLIFRGDRYAHVAERVVGSIDRVVVNMNYHLPGMLRDTSLRDYSEYN